jgi:hypothetical protein
MDEGLIRLEIIIGIPFCLVAALTAFLITYEGYMRGQNADKKLALRMALQTAFGALVVFAVLIVTIGFILARVIL